MTRDLALAATEELTGHILPFWLRLRDATHGGMYGGVGHDLVVDRSANKGAVATCRALWTFSAAYRRFGNPRYLEHAGALYQFVVEKLMDDVGGGVFWSVDHRGRPACQDKHVYAQAFAIYALSEYGLASGEAGAVHAAERLFQLVERRGFDPVANAYLEQFDRNWSEVPNTFLGEFGLTPPITMNTHLHVTEAYTNLYRATGAAQVRRRIENLLAIWRRRIYDPHARAFRVFFDRRWRSLADVWSFGHDIEASWLIDEATSAIGAGGADHHDRRGEAFDGEAGVRSGELASIIIDVAYSVAAHAVQPDGSVAHQRVAGRYDRTRVCWVQAEAITGFLNAYTRTGDFTFIRLALRVWEYVRNHLVDARPGGEWFEMVEADGSVPERAIAGPWKSSYHNGRLCLEIIKRAPAGSGTEGVRVGPDPRPE